MGFKHPEAISTYEKKHWEFKVKSYGIYFRTEVGNIIRDTNEVCHIV